MICSCKGYVVWTAVVSVVFVFCFGVVADDAVGVSDGVYVRVRPLSNRGRRDKPAKWDPVDYNSQEVLEIISDLKPDVLERYTDGRLDPDMLVPVVDGRPPMTVVEFLNASMRAGAPGCIITPRVSLWEYDKGTLFETAQSLYDLPVDPPLRIISLDNWSEFARTHEPEEVRGMFKKLLDQGWKHMAVNMVGGMRDPLGFASIAEFGIKRESGFSPDFDKLQRMKDLGTIKKHLLYIDFPKQTADFMELPPDERAEILVKKLAGGQQRHGYTFVWPILQGKWDSKRIFTSPSGKYGGASLYDVMKTAIHAKTEAATSVR